MAKSSGVRLVLKLKSDRNGQIYVKSAAHMRLDGTGRLLLYDGSHRLLDEISLADHTVQEITPVHWVREDVRPQAGASETRFESTFTMRLAMYSGHIGKIHWLRQQP